MFRQFLKLSFKMQAVFFFIFRAMYESESIATELIETVLIPLFKKDDPRDPKNYRFIHMKIDLARIFELLVYLKLEKHFDRVTSESQQGGMKQGDCVENLAMLASIIVDREDKGETLIMTAVDAVKCFDRVHLSDAHAALQVSGADRKALKVLYKLGENNNIKIAGGKRTIKITDGETQGGISAARRTTYMIDEATQRHARHIPNDKAVIHRDVRVDNEGSVDDELHLAYDDEGAALGAKLYTRALDELAMSAHPVKTVQIVAGASDKIPVIKARLEANPSKMQDFQIKVTEGDKYLGMHFVTGSWQETLDKNVRGKVGKMMAAACAIRNMCNIPGIKRIGKLQAQKLLIMSQITPICMYGMPAWLRVSDKNYEDLETGFKRAIETVLSVPRSINYEALLRQISNFHIRQFSDNLKLKCWNHKLHIKGRGKIVRVLKYEIAHGLKGGLAEELADTCKMYGLRNICEARLDPKTIDFKVKKFSYLRQWQKHLELRTLPMFEIPGKAPHWHHLYPFNEGRAYQAYELGLLVFKDSKEWMFPEKHRGDRKCLNIPCQDTDSLSHSLQCEYTKTKYMDTGDKYADMSRFLVSLNRERITNHGIELVIMPDENTVMDEEILDYLHIKENNKTVDAQLSNLISKPFHMSDRRGEQEIIPHSEPVKVSRLDKLSAAVCQSTLVTDVLIAGVETVGGQSTPHAHTNRVQVRGITDMMIGGRGQSVFRHEPARPQLEKKIRSLFATEESTMRCVKDFSYTFPQPEEDKGYRLVTENISTDSYVRTGLSVTHIRETIKTVTHGGREDTIIRHVTMNGGAMMKKVLRVRNTFHLDRYITLEVNTTSGEADVSNTDGTGGDDHDGEPRKKIRKSVDERKEHELQRRALTSDSDTSQSDSETIRQWMFDAAKRDKGEPSQPTLVNSDIGQTSNKADKPKNGVDLMESRHM